MALLGDGDRWTALTRILTAASASERRFQHGLARALDGIALDLARRHAK
jgi:hypothetical protein